MAVICVCKNCSAHIGGIRPGEPDKVKCPQFCKDCDTAEKRKEQSDWKNKKADESV